MSKKGLITGITGQDGRYLAKLLVDEGYEVYGLFARRTGDTMWRLRYLGIDQRVTLLEGDLTDLSSMIRAMAASGAEEVYNLGAQSFVATPWQDPYRTSDGCGSDMHAGGDSRGQSQGAVLPGFQQRDVREGS